VSGNFEITPAVKKSLYVVLALVSIVLVASPIGIAVGCQSELIYILSSSISIFCLLSIINLVILRNLRWCFLAFIVAGVIELIEIVILIHDIFCDLNHECGVILNDKHNCTDIGLAISFGAQLLLTATVAIMSYIVLEIHTKEDQVNSRVILALFVAIFTWEIGILSLDLMWSVNYRHYEMKIADYVGTGIAGLNIFLLVCSFITMRLYPFNCDCCFRMSPEEQQYLVKVSWWFRVINLISVVLVVLGSIAKSALDICMIYAGDGCPFANDENAVDDMVVDFAVLIGSITNLLFMGILIIIVKEKKENVYMAL